jgi:flagellar assembly protein FliH
MSSKILPPDSAQAVKPMLWRTVELPSRGKGGVFAEFPSLPRDQQQAAAALPPEPPKIDEGEQERQRERERQQQAQWEQRVRDAHAAGFREGEAAGRNKAAAEVQPVIERLSRSIEETAGLRAKLRREAEKDMVRLALAIARRVLFRELAVDPEALHGLVLAALEKLQGQDICRVRLHPSHATLVSTWLRQSISGSPVEVIPDSSRDPGTLIFETDRGSLDASVDSQLREIDRGLADRLRSSR